MGFDIVCSQQEKNEMKKTRGGASSTGYYVRHNDIFQKTTWSEGSVLFYVSICYLAPAAMKISATSAVLLVME